jgi:excisionase family DNA binding protein
LESAPVLRGPRWCGPPLGTGDMKRTKSNGEPPVAITGEEAARRLSVSRSTIRRLLARGELTRVRLGRSVRILAASVEALAARGGAIRGR